MSSAGMRVRMIWVERELQSHALHNLTGIVHASVLGPAGPPARHELLSRV